MSYLGQKPRAMTGKNDGHSSRSEPEGVEERQPIRWYRELPPETRVFIESLRPDQIIMLQKSMKTFADLQTIGKFGKWVILTFMAIFMAIVAFGDAAVKAWGWLHGPTK